MTGNENVRSIISSRSIIREKHLICARRTRRGRSHKRIIRIKALNCDATKMAEIAIIYPAPNIARAGSITEGERDNNRELDIFRYGAKFVSSA